MAVMYGGAVEIQPVHDTVGLLLKHGNGVSQSFLDMPHSGLELEYPAVRSAVGRNSNLSWGIFSNHCNTFPVTQGSQLGTGTRWRGSGPLKMCLHLANWPLV